ncbi:MAG: hypothetical protein GY757_12875, partial [bacterium]|nr:hypothetical protein [bacterium]
MKQKKRSFIIGFLMVVAVVFLQPQAVLAHCDSLDGPVIISAEKALKTG